MTVLTVTEQLENVQAAIAAIEDGAQSYSIRDRSYTRADLKTLYEREDRLLARYEREANNRSGARVRGATPTY